ncbi:TIM-barrel domain-containing protein [uncultured Sphaerochaeta sp.]|uniref:TIM-barrel domain-containing protein n=1 Tax=uncultured Sphaerochaeta sp. TaxID=886478 RepID=UPI002AA65596|nr:TIM-barrel domain-containing protein [uncultured Sphaerochaeta sp.]
MKSIYLDANASSVVMVEEPSSVRLQFKGSHLWGAGEHFDRVEFLSHPRRNEVEEVFTQQGTHTYLPQPLFLSDEYAFLVQSDRVFTIESQGDGDGIQLTLQGAFSSEDSLVIATGTPRETLKKLLSYLGGVVLPPPWVFGEWASANRWRSEQDVLEALDAARLHGFPISVLVVEAWSDESTFYTFGEEPGLWPDPKQLVQKLNDQGVHFILWQCPVFKALEEGRRDVRHEQDLAYVREHGLAVLNRDGTPYTIPEGNWFAGSMVPDFTNPETRDWWFSKRKYLMDMGLSGFKTDGGECILADDVLFHDGSTGKEMRNRYPQSYIEAYQEFIGPERITFSRAGYLGAQGSMLFWAGDQLSRWSELQAVLKAGLSAAISGIFWWGFDIGGFAGPMPSMELYLRSYELGSLVPVMQWHSEPVGGQFSEVMKSEDRINDRSPWRMAELYGEAVLSITKRYSAMRNEMRWYLVREATVSKETLQPMMRPMFYAFGSVYADIYDQYLLGSSLLVAPILEEGKKSRAVTLPDGSWYDLFAGMTITGPCTVEREYPIGQIGIFINTEDAEFERLRDSLAGLCSGD